MTTEHTLQKVCGWFLHIEIPLFKVFKSKMGDFMANKDIVIHAIANATKDLIRERTIDKISVTEICERTGLGRRNFYRYFKDKHDVIEWIFAHEPLTFSTRYENWNVWDYFPYITQTLYDDRDFYRHALQFHGQNSFRSYSISQLYDILEKDYQDTFSDKLSLDFYIDHICNMTFDAFMIWLSMEPCPPPEEFVAFFQKRYQGFSLVTTQNIIKERKLAPFNHKVFE